MKTAPYHHRKAEMAEYLRGQMMIMIQHAITASERADTMSTKSLEYKIRKIDRALDQLGWRRQRLDLG